MAGKNDEKRYSEEELALILRRAIELETPAPDGVQSPSSPHLPSRGFTLREIQEIASEVGIRPARIFEAADSLATPEWSPAARAFGGPATLSSERSIPRRLTEGEMGHLLDLVRDTIGVEGEAHEVLGGVEWKNGGQLTRVSVRITPGEGGSKLSVGVGRHGAAFLSHWVPMAGGLFTGAMVLSALDPAWQATFGLLAGGAATGYAVGRTIWARSSKKWKGVVEQLTAKVVASAASETPTNELPPGEE